MDNVMIDFCTNRSDFASGRVRSDTDTDKCKRKIQGQLEEAACSESYETYDSFTDSKYRMNVWMARRKGTYHEANGTPCQDCCISRSLPGCLVLTAADGVGSSRYSNLGATFACLTVIDAVEELLRKNEGREKRLVKDLMSSDFRENIVSRWLKAIHRLIKEIPVYRNAGITDFASTLMFAVVTRHNMITGILGDGQIMVLNRIAGFKVRTHGKKYTTCVQSLADPGCAREDFIVRSFSRKDFDTVILTTDGLYDSLSPGNHLYQYTLEACERFAEYGAPYQAFCYTEKGKHCKDFSRAGTQDDCTVVIAKSLADCPAKGFSTDRKSIARHRNASLLKGYSTGCRVYFTRTEITEDSAKGEKTASKSSAWAYSYVTSSYTWRYKKIKKRNLLLETACLDQPFETWKYGKFTYNAYIHNEGILPLRYLLDTGMLKESHADDGMISDLLTSLVLLQNELCKKGLRLNPSALDNLCYDTKNKKLHVRSEAITARKKWHDNAFDLYSACFSHLLGVIAYNQFILPVFHPGYSKKGKKIMLHLFQDHSPVVLWVYRRNSCCFLKNLSAYRLTDNDITVSPGGYIFLGNTAFGTVTPRTFLLSDASETDQDHQKRLKFTYIPLSAFDRTGDFL